MQQETVRIDSFGAVGDREVTSHRDDGAVLHQEVNVFGSAEARTEHLPAFDRRDAGPRHSRHASANSRATLPKAVVIINTE
jgi:hypothetical protein